MHPLHVESVAWISERKDVLSTAFWLLVMLAYLRGWKWWTAALFALGLMVKPMLVTLPFALMLLDWWPLGRWRDARSAITGKLALLVLTVASCAVTLVAQSAGGAVATLERFPLLLRAANALTSYARYVGKTFWPVDLAPQYPYDPSPSPWLVAAGALMLAGFSWVAWRARRSRPYLLVGWLWFVGTLVPVIGLVQVGHQAMADRYTYIPSIGLFVIIAWGVPDLLGRRRVMSAAAAVLVVIALAGAARVQAGHWRDSLALFTHAVRTTPGNVMAHVNLGAELQQAGRVDEAIEQYRLALEADPGSEGARANLAAGRTHRGLLLLRQERFAEAESEFLAALEIDPTFPAAWKSLGIAVFRQGRLDEAIAHFTESLRLDPAQEKVREDLENLRRLAGRD